MLTLERIEYYHTSTPGRLYLPGGLTLSTLENPWKDNEPMVSCIPPGDYRIERDFTGRHQLWKLLDVPERWGIEIHLGNRVADTAGCPLLGTQVVFDSASDEWRIPGGLSKPAGELFLSVMGPYQERGEVLRIIAP